MRSLLREADPVESNSMNGSMRQRFLRWIDCRIIRFAASRMPPFGRREPHLEEADQYIQQPDFFSSDLEPVHPSFGPNNQFTYPSPIETPFPENNRVFGRFYRCPGRWEDKPTVLLLHGWNDVTGYHLRFPFTARRFNRNGINAVVLALPYHFERRPTTPGAIRNCISEDVLRTVESTRQGVFDVRALAAWLLQQGCPSVGIWGVSMGAWIGGLALCHDPRINFGILMTPVVQMDRLVRELAFVGAIRNAIKDHPIDFSKFNLTTYKPLASRENVLLVKAEYDAFVPGDTVESLWNHWNNPEIWRLPHGHISVLSSLSLISNAVRWATAAGNRAGQNQAERRETKGLPSR